LGKRYVSRFESIKPLDAQKIVDQQTPTNRHTHRRYTTKGETRGDVVAFDTAALEQRVELMRSPAKDTPGEGGVGLDRG